MTYLRETDLFKLLDSAANGRLIYLALADETAMAKAEHLVALGLLHEGSYLPTGDGRAVVKGLRKGDEWSEASEQLNALDRHYYGQNAELVSFHRPSNWDSDPLSRTNPARGLANALMRAERDLTTEKGETP